MIMHDYIQLHQVFPAEIKLGQLIREPGSNGVRMIVALGMGNITEYCEELGIKIPSHFHADDAYPVLVQSIGLHLRGVIIPRKRMVHTILWLQAGRLYPLSRYGYWGQPKRFVVPITCTGLITNKASRRIK